MAEKSLEAALRFKALCSINAQNNASRYLRVRMLIPAYPVSL